MAERGGIRGRYASCGKHRVHEYLILTHGMTFACLKQHVCCICSDGGTRGDDQFIVEFKGP